MFNRTFMPQLQVTDFELIRQSYRPVDEQTGCTVVVRLHTPIVQVRQADEESPKEQTPYIAEWQQPSRFRPFDCFETVRRMPQPAGEDMQPAGMSAERQRP